MKIIYFAHAITSCWNNGNAHFQRGLLRALARLGHQVEACEPRSGWSSTNLVREHGEAPARNFNAAFPELRVVRYDETHDPEELIDNADLVIVHEWTDPTLVQRLGDLRRSGGRFALMFHDTHHRAISSPDEMRSFDLSCYDAVLAFGDSLAEVYRRAGWGRHVNVLHEAADTSRFFPPAEQRESARKGLVWIGNWGDDERSEELVSFLFRPARDAGLSLDVHGVRYPSQALRTLNGFGARYNGWVANLDVPDVFSRHLATVHVPRRYYAGLLPGIPTIRVFEALACGIPLISAPWQDSEGLFNAGQDYLMVETERQMRCALRSIRHDASLRRALTESGWNRVRSRHTCQHRAQQLVSFYEEISDCVRTEAIG